jgi:polyadenylation factor subunit 2
VFANQNSVHGKATVQAICLTNYEKFVVSGDKEGFIVYSNIKLAQKNKFQAHGSTCIRDLSLSNSSLKLLSCADDGTAKVFDFATSKEELCFSDHRSDVKSCDWHPWESLVLTGSKDSYVKIWDPRASGKGVHTLTAHNNIVTQVRWNPVNGNWFLTASRDSKIKIFDLRKTDKEFNCFEGHQDSVSVVAWHPFKEELFASASGSST